jgi:hypothetical protein
MVKLTQLILHFGDEMNVEQKRYGYGPSKYCRGRKGEEVVTMVWIKNQKVVRQVLLMGAERIRKHKKIDDMRVVPLEGKVRSGASSDLRSREHDFCLSYINNKRPNYYYKGVIFLCAYVLLLCVLREAAPWKTAFWILPKVLALVLVYNPHVGFSLSLISMCASASWPLSRHVVQSPCLFTIFNLSSGCASMNSRQ